jgi:hypothetical protein
MIDELLGEIFGEAISERLGQSRRVQLLMRLGFGLLGAVLFAVGAAWFLLKNDLSGNTAMRLSMVGLFLFLACLSLFNVALARAWRWPGRLSVLSFVALFVTRILFGP